MNGNLNTSPLILQNIPHEDAKIKIFMEDFLLLKHEFFIHQIIFRLTPLFTCQQKLIFLC